MLGDLARPVPRYKWLVHVVHISFTVKPAPLVFFYGILLVLGSLGLVTWWRMDLAWSALMHSSDFVDWPQLWSVRLMGLALVGTICLASASASLVFRVDTWTRRLYLASITGSLLMSSLAAGGAVGVLVVGCPEAAAARQLSEHVVAIASFNAAAYDGWCAITASKTAASMCGSTGASPPASFQSFATHADDTVGLWCRRVVATPIREQAPPRENRKADDASGCSPFCRLATNHGPCEVSGGWVTVFLATQVFVLFAASALACVVCTHASIQWKHSELTRWYGNGMLTTKVTDID